MLTYLASGVDVQKADILTNLIKTSVKSDNIGKFAGVFEHPYLKEYYFAAATDGIGSKIIPLIDYKMYECIANDLIAMSFNDLICVGAAPLFFLDYIATNKLDVDFTSKVINSLKNCLNEYNSVLLGGETSELKDLITEKYFDMAGFALGLVKKDLVLSQDNVKKGDVVIGLESNGIHSNGFTLLRKLYEQNLFTEEEFKSTLKPTYIYVKEILELCESGLIKVCANITGGGIKANLSRVIPQNLCAVIDKTLIPSQPVFEKLKTLVGEDECFKTFNMGLGFCIVCDSADTNEVLKICKKYNPFRLGVIKNNDRNCNICFG